MWATLLWWPCGCDYVSYTLMVVLWLWVRELHSYGDHVAVCELHSYGGLVVVSTWATLLWWPGGYMWTTLLWWPCGCEYVSYTLMVALWLWVRELHPHGDFVAMITWATLLWWPCDCEYVSYTLMVTLCLWLRELHSYGDLVAMITWATLLWWPCGYDYLSYTLMVTLGLWVRELHCYGGLGTVSNIVLWCDALQSAATRPHIPEGSNFARLWTVKTQGSVRFLRLGHSALTQISHSIRIYEVLRPQNRCSFVWNDSTCFESKKGLRDKKRSDKS